LSPVACPAAHCLSTLSPKQNDFKKYILNIECVFWFPVQLLSETFLTQRTTERDMIINIYLSSC
jgi:hypothetical protein